VWLFQVQALLPNSNNSQGEATVQRGQTPALQNQKEKCNEKR